MGRHGPALAPLALREASAEALKVVFVQTRTEKSVLTGSRRREDNAKRGCSGLDVTSRVLTFGDKWGCRSVIVINKARLYIFF